MSDGQLPPRSALGGQANEKGSQYRAGVAAYLAAHSLAGGVPHPGLVSPAGGVVVIKVESDNSVDDLECEFEDSTRYFIQAKHSCGIDAALRETVDQWVKAARSGEVKKGARLLLATGNAKGKLKDLAEALVRGRNPDAQSQTKAGIVALDRLHEMIEDGLTTEQRSRLLDSGYIIELDVASREGKDFRAAEALLEGTVVRNGQGPSAMEVLQHHFQEMGARRFASNRETWLEVLNDAGIDLVEDEEGGWSARATAAQSALGAYESLLAARRDLLPLHFVSKDIEPMCFEGLLGTIQVRLPNEDKRHGSDSFAEVCRRWRRLVLVGLPGSGKSTALVQLAASWASRPDAPTPLLVSLGRLSRRLRREERPISLAEVVNEAVTGADPASPLLVGKLTERVCSGRALLLFDGLDECGHDAPRVIDEIASILATVSEETFVVVSTRPSDTASASKLGFPEVELSEPNRYEAILEALVEHVAEVRAEDAEKTPWVRDRLRELDHVRKRGGNLFSVPLLGVLLTLLVCDGEISGPLGRSQILSKIISTAVTRWEALRPDEGSQGLRPDMLVDAFSEIGHFVAEADEPCRTRAITALAERYRDHWGRSIGDAEVEAAEDVEFWDDRMGVFVSRPSGADLVPRSRVFCEFADAMWIDKQGDSAARRAWVRGAVADGGRHEAVLLAVGLSEPITRDLVDLADEGNPIAAILAADGLSDAKPSDEELLARVIGAISELMKTGGLPSEDVEDSETGDKTAESFFRAINRAQARRDGPIWPFVLRACRLPLPDTLVPSRKAIIDRLAEDDEKVIARALAAIADIKAREEGSPSREQIEALERVLRLSPPPKVTSKTISRRRTVREGGDRLPLSGFGAAILGAIELLPTLDEVMAQRAMGLADHASFGERTRVHQLLTAAGFGTLVEESNKVLRESLSRFAKVEPWDSMRPLYELVASVASPAQLTLAQTWSLEQLADLGYLIRLGSLSPGIMEDAFRHSLGEMAFLLPLIARCAGLALPMLAAEADHALEIHDKGRAGEVVGLLFVPPRPEHDLKLSKCQMTEDDLARLVLILQCGSDWPFRLSTMMLQALSHTEMSERVVRILGAVPPRHREQATRLAAALAQDPVNLILRLTQDEDGLVRVGAARCARYLYDDDRLDEHVVEAVQNCARSDDFSERSAILDMRDEVEKGDVTSLISLARTPPRYWTCSGCGERQEFDALGCKTCRDSARPDLPRWMWSDLPWADVSREHRGSAT